MSSTTTVNIEEFLEENVKETVEKTPWMKNHEMVLCSSVRELADFVDTAITSGVCALDTETTGLNTRTRRITDNKTRAVTIGPTDTLVGLCLACSTLKGLYVPVGHKEGAELNLPLEPVLDQIRRLCKNCTTVYHNAKFDVAMLRNNKVMIDDPDRVEDTEILSRLYDAGTQYVGLKPTAEKILDRKMIEFEDIAGKSKRLDYVSPRHAYVYGASDAICTLDLFTFFMSQPIIKEQKGVYRLEKRTLFVVLEMEANLVKVDLQYLTEAKKIAEKKLKEIEQGIYKLVGREFDIASTQQLGKILFDELGYVYPEKERTKSGQYETSEKVLTKLAVQYPIVQGILDFRGLEKCLGTYLDKMLVNHDEDDCIKLGFKQTGTETGRFSSPGGKGKNPKDGSDDGYSGVNVQALPGRDDETPDWMPDIRRSFVARPGYKIAALDYQNEEMRVATNLSKEPKWMDALLNDGKNSNSVWEPGDLHAATGRAILGRDPTKGERKTFKVVNFQSLYGSGPRGIALNAKISEGEARRVLQDFFAQLPALKKWMDRVKIGARKDKRVVTEFGRIRPLEYTGDRETDSRSDRQAVNTKIQAVCADIMKTAMSRVYSYIHINGLQDEIRLLITMHDELVFEIKEDKIGTHIPVLANIMRLEDILQGMLHWPIPLPVDAEYGDSWHVDHDFFKEHPDAIIKEPYVFHRDGVVNSRYEIAKAQESASVQAPPSDQPTETAPAGTEEVQKPLISEAIQNHVESPSEPPDSTPIKEPEGSSPELLDEGKKGVKKVDETVIDKGEPTEGVSEFGADSEIKSRNHLTSDESLIYVIKSRESRTLRMLNFVLLTLCKEEQGNLDKLGPRATLVVRDREGNSLLVSKVVVPRYAFLTLAHLFGL